MGNGNIAMDGSELFSACLTQATLVVKQVLPSHFANPTPNTEWDVRDLMSHMLMMLEKVPEILNDTAKEIHDEFSEDDELENDTIDMTIEWQAAADKAEAAILESDLETLVYYNDEEVSIENCLLQIAGDLLIHSWDLGEAIGMPVRFVPEVAEAVMETTVIPNSTTLPNHTLFNEPVRASENADLQTRLLAVFGRSRSWRSMA